MGTLTVIFKGVITHFKELVVGPEQVVHRAVLVNASGENVINGIRIPPHFARITIPGVADQVLMQGVSLTLNAAPPLHYEHSYEETIPGLAAQLSQIEELGPFNSSLVLGQQWPAVAAHFTVAGGKFKACLSGGAAEARLEIDTDADVATLQATSFPGAPPLPFAENIELPIPTTILIGNLAEGAEMMDNPRSHFFLHYLLAAEFPSAPQSPLELTGQQCELLVQTGVDVGCSDSNYP